MQLFAGRGARTFDESDSMNRHINLAAAAVTFGGAAILAAPVHANTFDCSEAQWAEAQARVNAYCPGASYSVSCNGAAMVVTILACPPGNG